MAWREAKRAAERASKDAAAEDRPAGAILDLDDPEIGIALDLTGDVGVGGWLVDRLGAGGAEPDQLAFESTRLGEDGEAVLELVELDEDGTGIAIAAPRHDHRNRLRRR